MAANALNLSYPRNLLYEAIKKEIRSWADLPRRIFMQAHYAGKSVSEIASQSGCETQEVLQILETHESKLRKALRAFRIG
jgi:DNA-directed RNA polymerase specialized sigma24 family protein